MKKVIQLLGFSSTRFVTSFLIGLLAICFYGGCSYNSSDNPSVIPIDTLQIAAIDSMLSPEVLKKFADDYDVKVKLTEFEPENLWSIISSPDAKRYHIFFTPHYMTAVLKDSIGIAPIADFYKGKEVDEADEAKYFPPRRDSLSSFSLPYYFSFMGILTNWKHINSLLNTGWEKIFMPVDSLKKENDIIVKINNYSFYHVLKSYNPDSYQNDARNDTSLTTFFKKQAPHIQINNTGYDSINSDTLLSAIVWSHQAERAIRKDKDLLFEIPDKYVLIHTYDFQVNSSVTDTTTINIFFRHITQPRIVAENTNFSHVANLYVNSWAFVSPSIYTGPSYDYPKVHPSLRYLPVMEYPRKMMFQFPADLLHK